MSRLRIASARLVDPASGLDRRGDLCVEHGHIVALGETPSGFAADTDIDATGQIACPGLIDICARATGGHATIASEAAAAAAGGITTMVWPPDTQPLADSPAVIESIYRHGQEAGAARVLPIGGLTLGQAGERLAEMAALRDAGCPALADGGSAIRDTLVLRRALDYAATLGLAVMLDPADPWLAVAGCMHEGAVATRRGLPGIPASAESAGLGRVLNTAADVGGAVHVGRLSAADALPLLAAYRQAGLPISADVAIHQLFLTEHDAIDFDPSAHLNPPLRALRDRQALRHAVARDEIDIICSDHTPLGRDAKDGPFAATRPGASGLDTLLALVLRLVDEEVVTLGNALAKVTCAPADMLGLTAGRLAVGVPADICVFDPGAVWWCTPEALRSRGTNSPFSGWELTGRATHTLVGGQLVYSDE